MDQNIYAAGGSNIHVSKLVFNKFKKFYQDSLLEERHTEDILPESVSGPILNFHPQFVSQKLKTDESDIENKQLFANSSLQKRKFEEIEKNKNELKNTFSPKFPKISDSSYLKEENYWEQYSSLKPYTIKSYSSLLSSKPLIPNLMDDSKFSLQINSLSSLNNSKFCSSIHSNKSPSAYLVKKCYNSVTAEETCDIYNVQNLNSSAQFDSNSKYASKEQKLINKGKKMTYAANDSSESIPSSQIHHKDNLSLERLSFSRSSSAISASKHTDHSKANATHIDDVFITAAGKSISISNNAMLAAQGLIQSVFQDETHQHINKDTDCISVEKKQFIKMAGLKKHNLISCATRNHKDDEKIITGEIDSKSINKIHEPDVSYDTDSVSFCTAAGKTVDVSEAAMKAAHKLIQDVFDNEDQMMPFTSGSLNTHKDKSAFKDIGCPPKKLLIEDNDETMDKALLENFFQDAAFFDKKESQDTTESSKDKDLNKVLESKINNDPTSHKKRKSLGGRRSMKFY